MENFDINNHVNELIAAGYRVDHDDDGLGSSLYWWININSDKFSRFFSSCPAAWEAAWEHFKSSEK